MDSILQRQMVPLLVTKNSEPFVTLGTKATITIISLYIGETFTRRHSLHSLRFAISFCRGDPP